MASNVWAVNCSLCPRILDSVETCLYDLVHSIKKCRSPCFSEVSGGALALPESDSELEDAAHGVQRWPKKDPADVPESARACSYH